MLQTRNGKRTGPAAVRIAVDMVEEGLITKKEAVLRVAPQQLDQLLHPVFDPHVAQEADEDHHGHAGLARAPRSAAWRSRAEDAVELAQERSGDSGPQGNHARRYSRHGRREGHSDGGRRQVEPRGGGRARHGPALRRGRRRASRSTSTKKVSPSRSTARTITVKEGDGFRSTAPRRSLSRPGEDRSSPIRTRRYFGKFMELGRRVPRQVRRARQRRYPARCQGGAPVRRRRHRPVPHRAHVLRRRSHRRTCRR